MTPVFAHAGHWLVQLLYLAPLVVMGAVLISGHLRRRREDRRNDREEGS
jgi:hypothetical protein